MRRLFIVITVTSCFWACKQSAKELVATNPQITLLLVQPQLNRMAKTPTGMIMGIGAPGEELLVVDSNYVYHPIKVKYAPENDTVRINLGRDQVQVNFRYKAFDELHFLFKKGDSVVVTYDSARIITKVINRETKLWDLNLDSYFRVKLYHNDYPALAKAFYTGFIVQAGSQEMLAPLRKKFLDDANIQTQKENSFLDSLLDKKLISKEYYDFFNARNAFRLETIKLLQSDHYVRPEWTKDTTYNANQFHIEFVFRLLSETIESKMTRITTNTGSNIDYRIAFDRVAASADFTLHEKDILLSYVMERIISYGSKNDIEQYFTKFSAAVTNKKLIVPIKSAHNLDFNSSAELQLKSRAAENKIFREVLESQKGKVVYVDFWASWCAPCIAALPASEQLRKDYKDKEVSFIFLSKDEDFDKWLKAAEKHNLTIPHSYIINNQYNSDMLEELKIREIPRYLLYDKQGNLVHKNAPGPEGDGIRKLFDTYLKQN